MSANGKPQRPFWFAPTNNIIHIGIRSLGERGDLLERLRIRPPAPRIHALEDATLAELVRLASQPLPALTVDEEREVLAASTKQRRGKSSRRMNIERDLQSLLASGQATATRHGRRVRITTRPAFVNRTLAALRASGDRTRSEIKVPGTYTFDPRVARRRRS